MQHSLNLSTFFQCSDKTHTPVKCQELKHNSRSVVCHSNVYNCPTEFVKYFGFNFKNILEVVR